MPKVKNNEKEKIKQKETINEEMTNEETINEETINEEATQKETIKEVVKQKRGRKSKKFLMETANAVMNANKVLSCNYCLEKENNNEEYNNEEYNNEELNISDKENKDNNIVVLMDETSLENENVFNKSTYENDENKPYAKKRGRKPKGGKIIQQPLNLNNNKETKPNVILHLKCFLKELNNNTLQGPNIKSYNFSQSKNDLGYEIITSNNDDLIKPFIENENVSKIEDVDEDISIKIKDNEIKEIWKKLKCLEHNLHINNISDKKSACFWCTCDFDNPSIYIPKYYIKDSYTVYGCFCSPECATAYLMEENLDSSVKFERYYLINHIYSKIYNYSKNIKPAPNPYYMLDKYYGNLTIQEYRHLLKNERLFLIVDKPLTRILPELHEDNDDFIINNKIIPSNNFQIKKKIQKKNQSKNNILNEKFGLTQ